MINSYNRPERKVMIEFDYKNAHHLLHVINQSNRLFHLLKGSYEEVTETMCDILVHRRLKGGVGFIRGGFECVCVGELPMQAISQYLADPNALDQGYKPFGILLDKRWFFHRGGRPVVYQPAAEYELLHETMKHLHMPYHPDDEYDFSWIREWRVKTPVLALDIDHATAVFPTREWKNRVLLRAGELGALVNWQSVTLTDIGLSVPESRGDRPGSGSLPAESATGAVVKR